MFLIFRSNASWRWRGIFKVFGIISENLRWQIRLTSEANIGGLACSWPTVKDLISMTNKSWNNMKVLATNDIGSAQDIFKIPISKLGTEDWLAWTNQLQALLQSNKLTKSLFLLIFDLLISLGLSHGSWSCLQKWNYFFGNYVMMYCLQLIFWTTGIGCPFCQ